MPGPNATVVQNLIENAVNYRREKTPRIDVSIIERHGGPILGRVRTGARLDVVIHRAGRGSRYIVSNADSAPIEILLVEDNPGDVRLTREGLRDGKVRNHLSVVSDGVEALEFLRHQGQYADAPRPGLILLDLNLPRVDGRQVLAEIKSDPELHRIPVVVLTTSRSDEDVLKSYGLRANAYVTKPVDLEQFLKVVQSIEDFWLTLVTLPPR